MTARKTRSPVPDALRHPLIERFRQAIGRLLPEGARLGLAVSGGPDSLAMLLLAQAAIPDRFEVATVDHGLRRESAGECAMVARVCGERGIPCEVLRVVLTDGNVQSKAREARYAALADWAERRGLSAIATAHHADDQAETLLMRLNRGSGTSGLSGVREEGALPGSEVRIVRPLLDVRRAELAEVIGPSDLVPVVDLSNADDRFDRARLRKALADAPWLDVAAVARSAAHLADADEVLNWAARREWSECVAATVECLRYTRTDAPRGLALRVVEAAIVQLGGRPRGGDVARLLDRLEAGAGGNVAGVLVTVEGTDWVFRHEPARRAGN